MSIPLNYLHFLLVGKRDSLPEVSRQWLDTMLGNKMSKHGRYSTFISFHLLQQAYLTNSVTPHIKMTSKKIYSKTRFLYDPNIFPRTQFTVK